MMILMMMMMVKEKVEKKASKDKLNLHFPGMMMMMVMILPLTLLEYYSHSLMLMDKYQDIDSQLAINKNFFFVCLFVLFMVKLTQQTNEEKSSNCFITNKRRRKKVQKLSLLDKQISVCVCARKKCSILTFGLFFSFFVDWPIGQLTGILWFFFLQWIQNNLIIKCHQHRQNEKKPKQNYHLPNKKKIWKKMATNTKPYNSGLACVCVCVGDRSASPS